VKGILATSDTLEDFEELKNDKGKERKRKESEIWEAIRRKDQ